MRAKSALAKKAPKTAENVTTAVYLDTDDLRLLRAVSLRRAASQSTRPSVSAVIAKLIEDNRSKLRAEAGVLLTMAE
jgi:hypothetical protein